MQALFLLPMHARTHALTHNPPRPTHTLTRSHTVTYTRARTNPPPPLPRTQTHTHTDTRARTNPPPPLPRTQTHTHTDTQSSLYMCCVSVCIRCIMYVIEFCTGQIMSEIHKKTVMATVSPTLHRTNYR